MIRNPGFNNGGSGSQSGSSAFFSNTGAVAGVFVAVGLVCTLGIIGVIAFLLKRRRRQRLDRDVTAAAAAAAAGSHHHRTAFDDDDDISPPMTQYGGFYAGTTGTPGVDVNGQPQPAGAYHDYEDPAGGYDHYATQMQPMPPTNGFAGEAGDRFSTATAPGLAGFGAQSAQRQMDYGSPEGYEYPPGHQHQGGYDSHGHNGAYSYTDEPQDPYGGYSDQHMGVGAGAGRRGSAGSLPQQQENGPGLKVTNV